MFLIFLFLLDVSDFPWVTEAPPGLSIEGAEALEVWNCGSAPRRPFCKGSILFNFYAIVANDNQLWSTMINDDHL